MKQCLLEIFEEYGRVVAIIAKKNILMRGQAFVIYDKTESAIEAKQQMHNLELFGKPIKIQFAKNKSNLIGQRDPTFQPIGKIEQNMSLKELLQKRRKEKKKFRDKTKMATGLNQNPAQNNIKSHSKTVVPHNILFVEGLSPEITHDMLVQAFSAHSGYKEVRLIASRHVAFVEYEDEFKAGQAMQELMGTSIGNCVLQINYANK